MSERERWVVYPLLFLTLGIALRDKMLKRVDTDNVVAERAFSTINVTRLLQAEEVNCRRLVVRSPNGRKVAIISADPRTRGGKVEIYGANGKVIDTLGGRIKRAVPWFPWSGQQPNSKRPKIILQPQTKAPAKEAGVIEVKDSEPSESNPTKENEN